MTDANSVMCEICRRNGVQSHLYAYQINLSEAVYLCENSTCSYPVGLHQDSVIFTRSLTDVPAHKLKDAGPAIPPAQLTLQNQAASQIGSHGQRPQRGVTATQTSRPNSINLLKRNGVLDSNGITNGHQSQSQQQHRQQKHERFNFSTDNRQAKTSSQSKTRSHNNSASPDFTAFQFGSKPSREVTQQTRCEQGQLGSSPGAVSQQNGLAGVKLSSNVSSHFDMSSNTSCMSETSNVSSRISNGQTGFSSLDLKSNRNVTNHTDLLLCKTAARLGAIAGTSANMCQDTCVVLPDISIPVDSSSVNTCAKRHLNIPYPVANSPDGRQPGDNSPAEYPSMFLQWKNKEALCWLDVVLCLLVHNKTLQSSLKEASCDESSIVTKLLTAQQQAQNILLSLDRRSTAGADVSLDKLINASQLTGSSYKQRRPNTRTLTVVSPSGTDGVNVKTGAGCHINATTEQSVSPENDDANCESLTSELNKAEGILNTVREDIWEHLKPSLKCEKGQNDSPVFAFPLIFRDNPGVEDLFMMKGKYVSNCTRCGLAETNEVEKIMPTFPAVVKQFDINKPVHKKKCVRCGLLAQRKLVYERLAPCLLMHFMEGLPHKHWHWLQFEFGGRNYTVTGVIQYKNNPDHFIAWLRNPTSGQWMKCDDLASPITVFQSKPPPFPPKQIHIVMWEAIQPSTPMPASVDISGNTSMTTLTSDKTGSLQKGGIWSSTSSICSQMSECQVLPEFVSSVPAVLPGVKPVACRSEANETEMVTQSTGLEAVSDISGIDNAKVSTVPFVVHKPQPRKAAVVTSDPVKSMEEGCMVSVGHHSIIGQVPVIKPSSVFTVPSNGNGTKQQIIQDTPCKGSAETTHMKQSLTLVKGPVQTLDQALSPALLPGGQNRFKVVFAKACKQSQSTSGNTISMGKTKALTTTDVPNNSTQGVIMQNKPLSVLELVKGRNTCPKQVGAVTTPISSQTSSPNVHASFTPSQRNIVANPAIIPNRLSHSTQSNDRILQRSSATMKSTLATPTTGKPSSSGSFKQPTTMNMLRNLKACSVGKATGASLSRDAFKTMKFSRSKGVPSSTSPVLNGTSPASSNGSTPHDSPLPRSGNLNYLSAVKQYLLNKSTNVAVGSQFKGMSLKSKSSDNLLNFTQNFSDTVDCLKYSEGILSPQSEYFGRKASSPHQSTASDNLLQIHCKRKADSEILAPALKMVKHTQNKNGQQNVHSINNVHNRNVQNNSLIAFTTLHDTDKTVDCSLTTNKSPSPQKSETSSTGADDILHELYTALDIPMDTVGDTMSNLMSDVDDILGLVQANNAETQVFTGLDLGHGLSTSPMTVPGFSLASTTASSVVSQAGPMTEGVAKGR